MSQFQVFFLSYFFTEFHVSISTKNSHIVFGSLNTAALLVPRRLLLRLPWISFFSKLLSIYFSPVGAFSRGCSVVDISIGHSGFASTYQLRTLAVVITAIITIIRNIIYYFDSHSFSFYLTARTTPSLLLLPAGPVNHL